MKTKLPIFPAILFLAAILFRALPASAWPSVYPTGLTIHDRARAFEGFTLFVPLTEKSESTIYLIDANGQIAHRWAAPISVLHAQLLPDGHLLLMGRNDRQEVERPGVGKYEIGGAAGLLVELDWEGRRVWKHSDLNMHHDFARLSNGHTIYLIWEKVPISLQKRVRGGVKGSEFSGGVMFNDGLVEVDATGKTVWQWSANAHLDPNLDIIGPLYKREEWLHCNSLAVLKNGDIALSSRQTDALLIVEKKTGRIRFRWGSAAYLDNKTIEMRAGAKTLGGPHDVSQIDEGLPGAGHLLCYDNGLYADASRAVEIDLETGKEVWQSSQAGIGRVHFSAFAGSAQRLPNGNTLISEAAGGRFFQIASDGEIVWEYVNPFMPSAQYQGAVFQAQCYAPNFCPQLQELTTNK